MKILLKEGFDSSNLFKKMSLLTESQVNQILKGLDWTSKNYSNAVIVGGTALIHYLKKSRNLTPDLDFLVEDISDVKAKLDEDGFKYSDLIGVKGNMGITVNAFNTDYLDAKTSGNQAINKLVLKTAKRVNIGGYSVKIVIPELLAIMKIELSRDKDVSDGLALISSKILNKDVYLMAVNGLKNYISDYESLLSYAEIL